MTAQVGVRVVRGPDWDGGDEDGGEGHVGTVIELLSNHKVRVLWDTGEESTCRTGSDRKFDLRIFDTAQIGVRHPGTKCADCKEQDIFGMLWRCTDCGGADFCTLCYNDDNHDLRHQFVRIDVADLEGETLKKRKFSARIRTLGTFPGAKVTRGKDWAWEDQDGGPRSEGEVTGYMSAPDSSRNLVHVQWSRGGPGNVYRMGFQGFVDLTCVEEEAGPFYYRDHLPVLSTLPLIKITETVTSRSSAADDLHSKTLEANPRTLTSSDQAELTTSATGKTSSAKEAPGSQDTIEDKDASRGAEKREGSANTENSGVGKTAKEDTAMNVESTAANGQDNIKMNEMEQLEHETSASNSENQWTISVGDSVAITVGAERLMELQKGFGGCPSDLVKAIGTIGTVTDASGKGTVTVSFLSTTYTLNPDVLIQVPQLKEGATVRIRPDEEEVKILNSRVGWKAEMADTIGKFGRILKIDNHGDLLVGFGRRFHMFAPACCLPGPDGGKTVSLSQEAVTEKSQSDPDRGAKQTSSDSKTEDVQDLYRKLREAILGDAVQPSYEDVVELLAAVSAGDPVAVRILCETNRSIVEGEAKGITPLILAVEKRNRQIVEILLEFGADVNHGIPPIKTALGAAIACVCDELVGLLLERGANPFFLDPKGHNYLHCAAFSNLGQSIPRLAAYGVDVNQKDDFEDTPLHVAIDQRMNEAAAAFVGLDNLDFSVKNKRGHPPLHNACLTGNARAVELIVARDKSQLTVLTYGSTPLHIAAQNDFDECVRILVLNGGADINCQHWKGGLYTPLHLACIRGKFSAVEALLELDADIHLKDKNGDTPLHLAIGGRVIDEWQTEAGQEENHMRVAIACMLISRGAYVDVENNKGRNPLLYGVPPVRDGIKQFIKHNPELVKRKGGGGSKDSMKSLGLYSHLDKGRGDLREALKGVGLPCGVCGKPKSDVTLRPCQHNCVCSTCKDKVTKCPLCDDYVTEKIVTGPDENPADLEACKQM